jgi:signal transduction histidine kinase
LWHVKNKWLFSTTLVEQINNTGQIPPLQQQPFGINALGDVISEASGVWINAGINILKEKSSGGRSVQVEQLINKLQGVLQPAYAASIDESFLTNRWNKYSAEFAFAFAAICRQIVGPDHTKEATQKVPIVPPQEALPLDFLTLLGGYLIGEGLLGGKIIFRKNTEGENSLDLDIVYPFAIKAIPGWKEIAYDQQEAHLARALASYWGLKNIKTQPLGRYDDEKHGYYGFEYRILWQGGERSPQSNGLFAGKNPSQDYLKHKTWILFDFINYLKTQNNQEALQTYQQALNLRTRASDEYETVKTIVEEQGRTIEALKYANRELEGVIHYLSAEEEKLQHESASWKASKVASDQLKRQAEEMAQIKSRLTSMVSHELRTPLSSLLGFTELMLDGEFEPEQIKEFLTTIYTESARMKDLLDEFLDMQRLESGRIELNLGPCDFNEMLKYITMTFKGYASGVNIVTTVPPNMPPLRADKSKIEQVMKNFVSNAIKYSPNGGDVQIFVTCNDSMATICVADQGLGIPEDAMPKLFQEFYRVERETHINIKGTGLGLSITKQLVEAHGGSVWVESKLGVGSKFFFTIPVYKN